MRSVFEKFEKNESGTVSLDDLLKVMKELKLPTGGADVINALKMAGAGAPVKYDKLLSRFANSI